MTLNLPAAAILIGQPARSATFDGLIRPHRGARPQPRRSGHPVPATVVFSSQSAATSSTPPDQSDHRRRVSLRAAASSVLPPQVGASTPAHTPVPMALSNAEALASATTRA